MQYISKYKSQLGEMLLVADDTGLTGVRFNGQRHFSYGLSDKYREKNTAILKETELWLNDYFKGKKPEGIPCMNLQGTEFQLQVWNILQTIPYGETLTYGDIAKILTEERGLLRMSAQAVGGAVGRNPVGIIVPCHRVIGAGGKLTGYAGGLDKKEALLKLEGVL